MTQSLLIQPLRIFIWLLSVESLNFQYLHLQFHNFPEMKISMYLSFLFSSLLIWSIVKRNVVAVWHVMARRLDHTDSTPLFRSDRPNVPPETRPKTWAGNFPTLFSVCITFVLYLHFYAITFAECILGFKFWSLCILIFNHTNIAWSSLLVE